jgi:hypothetical protein
VFEVAIGFKGNSIVSAKVALTINKMGMPGIRSYSWVEINCKY